MASEAKSYVLEADFSTAIPLSANTTYVGYAVFDWPDDFPPKTIVPASVRPADASISVAGGSISISIMRVVVDRTNGQIEVAFSTGSGYGASPQAISVTVKLNYDSFGINNDSGKDLYELCRIGQNDDFHDAVSLTGFRYGPSSMDSYGTFLLINAYNTWETAYNTSTEHHMTQNDTGYDLLLKSSDLQLSQTTGRLDPVYAVYELDFYYPFVLRYYGDDTFKLLDELAGNGTVRETFICPRNYVAVALQGGGGSGASQWASSDGWGGAGGGCAIFVLNIGYLREHPQEYYRFFFGSGGKGVSGQTAFGAGNRGTDSKLELVHEDSSTTELAIGEGGEGGWDGNPNPDDLHEGVRPGGGFILDAAISGGYCYKMPGLTYVHKGDSASDASWTGIKNAWRHCDGGWAHGPGNNGQNIDVTFCRSFTTSGGIAQSLGEFDKVSHSYDGGKSSNANSGGGGGASFFGQGGNGGSNTGEDGLPGYYGSGGGGARYYLPPFGYTKGGDGGNGCLQIWY